MTNSDPLLETVKRVKQGAVLAACDSSGVWGVEQASRYAQSERLYLDIFAIALGIRTDVTLQGIRDPEGIHRRITE